jgi:hypothetical protein
VNIVKIVPGYRPLREGEKQYALRTSLRKCKTYIIPREKSILLFSQVGARTRDNLHNLHHLHKKYQKDTEE